ncbi:cystathionine gamma-synthase [Arsenicicoccus bolidensis]|uniref:Cystathionine gamma-synthase n=1 Tax=Arsenicicoccus bolidensis TaxID=229480 RepID=A0ABS9Q364_9MICO|nr:cystathionine gamma-synthase [Arsenicicoccus bolidensis]MCG7322319.1 cystathionine gamma-synthase [Arsenicicoccus bolidensis]
MTELSRLTRAIRTGLETDPAHGAVVPPIYLSSNYTFEELGTPRRYDYTRSGNPTRDLLGDALATLEGGAGGVVTTTGMGAITVVVSALLSPGQTIVIPHDCYGGTWRLFDSLSRKGAFEVVTVDYTDPAQVEAALRADKAPTVVWIETPSNPLLRITDVRAVASAAHEVGATVVADNTFLSPLLCRPIELGCDVVLHSTTKYVNGHSDVVGGAVIGATEELHEQLAWWANVLGLTGSPFDSYLTLRGLRTLHTRMKAHEENARAVAELIAEHPAVSRALYPGLASHPGHELATSQQDGYGAIVSLELAGGEAQVRAFLDGLQCFSLAESLGGVESLVVHPSTMTHASMTPEAREVAGIGDQLLRLSIGIEATEDLVADVRAGLDRALATS